VQFDDCGGLLGWANLLPRGRTLGIRLWSLRIFFRARLDCANNEREQVDGFGVFGLLTDLL
jgi:hypothetical protein